MCGAAGWGVRRRRQGARAGAAARSPLPVEHSKACPWPLPIAQAELAPSCSPAEQLGEGQTHCSCLGAGRTRGAVVRQQADGRGNAPCLLWKTLGSVSEVCFWRGGGSCWRLPSAVRPKSAKGSFQPAGASQLPSYRPSYCGRWPGSGLGSRRPGPRADGCHACTLCKHDSA